MPLRGASPLCETCFRCAPYLPDGASETEVGRGERQALQASVKSRGPALGRGSNPRSHLPPQEGPVCSPLRPLCIPPRGLAGSFHVHNRAKESSPYRLDAEHTYLEFE